MAYARLVYPLLGKVVCEDYKDLYEAVSPGIFMLRSNKAPVHCAGFFINNKGVGISSFKFYSDVKTDLKNCVLVYQGKEYPIELLRKSPENSLIVVKAKSLEQNFYLKICSLEFELGTTLALFAVNPAGVVMFEPGYLLEKNNEDIRASCRGGWGYEGGALVSLKGEVLGVNKGCSGIFKVFDSVSLSSSNLIRYLQANSTLTNDGWRF